MPRLNLAVLVGLTLAAASAGAQDVTVHLTEPYAPGQGSVTAYGYYMSPYSGTVDGTTERLNCLDFFHEVTVGETWTAVQVNLGAAIADPGLLTTTRDGSPSNTYYGSVGAALKTYEEVAWLTAQMPTNPASSPDVATAIQTAIWYIASNAPGSANQFATIADYWNTGKTNQLAYGNTGATGYWINQASTQYNNVGAGYYNDFDIITDVNLTDPKSAQEFMFTTPEPGTMTLVATGFLAVLGVGTRRRRVSLAS